MGVGAVAPPVRIAVGAVDVVPPVERVEIPGVALALVVNRPAVEQHHGDVEAPFGGEQHPPAQPGEVLGIEAGEIEAGQTVESQPGAGAQPGARLEVVEPRLVRPQADDVMAPRDERVEIALEVEAAGALAVLAMIDEVVPMVRAREVHGTARAVLEVAGVSRVNAKGRHAAELERSTGPA